MILYNRDMKCCCHYVIQSLIKTGVRSWCDTINTICFVWNSWGLSHQPSLDVLGPYIMDTLLLFQCFWENDHHGRTWLCTPLFTCKSPCAAILVEGVRKTVGETDGWLATSHLQSSLRLLLLLLVMAVGGRLSHSSPVLTQGDAKSWINSFLKYRHSMVFFWSRHSLSNPHGTWLHSRSVC